MKKYITTIALLLTLGGFAFLTHADTSAKELPRLEQSGIEKLAEAINRAVDAFAPKEAEPVSPQFNLETYHSHDPFECFDDIASYPWSTNYKEDVQWQIDFIPRGITRYEDGSTSTYAEKNQPYSQFLDINGDGLLDYLYVDSYEYYGPGIQVNYPKKYLRSCVMINTGTNWERAYVCKATINYTGNDHFQGDCAEVTP